MPSNKEPLKNFTMAKSPAINLHKFKLLIDKIAYGLKSIHIVPAEPNKLDLFYSSAEGNKLSTINKMIDRINTQHKPYAKATPYSYKGTGGIRVLIHRQPSVKVYKSKPVVEKSKLVASPIFDSMYKAVGNRLASIVQISIQNKTDTAQAVQEFIKASSIEDSIIDSAVHQLGYQSLNDLVRISIKAANNEYDDPDFEHFAHSSIGIDVKDSSKGNLRLNKGDPFSYKIDPKTGILILTLPMHESTEARTKMNSEYASWIISSDPGSKKIMTKYLGV
jgi:hypothetical protein